MKTKIEVRSFYTQEHSTLPPIDEQIEIQIDNWLSSCSGRLIQVVEKPPTISGRIQVRVYMEVQVDDSVAKIKKILAEADAKYAAEKRSTES